MQRIQRYCLTVLVSTMSLAASFMAQAFPVEPTPGTESLTLTLQPTWHGSQVDGLWLRYRFRPTSPDQPIKLDWPTLLPELGRTSDQLTDLQLQDDRGNLPFHLGTSTAGQQTYRSDRAPFGTVRVSYRVPVAQVRPPHRGPHKELQAVAGGLETSGAGVLLLPEANRFQIDAHWMLPQGVQARGSFGNKSFKATVDKTDLLAGYFLAGAFQTYPVDRGRSGFSVYMLGQSRITTPAFLDWTQRVYEAERRAFHGSSRRRFPVFEVSFDGGVPDSGTADANGVFMYIPQGDPAPDWMLRILIAHEMVHVWQPAFSAVDSTDWFIEGTANYLESALPYQAGLISRDDFLHDINEHAKDYYTNPLRNIGNSQIAAAKWTSPTSWSVPYNRGFFYFANLDARVRWASHGTTTLVDLLRRYAAKRQPDTADVDTWRAVVDAAIGKQEVKAFDDMLAGATIQPDPAAFGPSVQQQATTYTVVSPGFSLQNDGHTVANVQPDSAEAKAGLRAGDVLTGATPKTQDIGKPFTLFLRRGQQSQQLHYLPQAKQVAGFTWLESTH